MCIRDRLNTDPYLNNLINYGIEGKHYTKIDDNTIKIVDNTPYTLQGYQWMQGLSLIHI